MTIFHYAKAITDAIERGDAARLRRTLDGARKSYAEQGGDLSKAIKKGEAALKRLKAKK
jgi:hypothetical protein